MNLYIVTRNDSYTWDNYDSFIVACESEEEARKTHPSHGDGWGRDWITKDQINTLTIELLGQATPNLEKGVVLSSFSNG